MMSWTFLLPTVNKRTYFIVIVKFQRLQNNKFVLSFMLTTELYEKEAIYSISKEVKITKLFRKSAF